MVTVRGGRGADPDQSSGPQQKQSPRFLCAEDETLKDRNVKPASSILRKSLRLQNISGGGRSGLRRSSRATKPTSRYQASNILARLMMKGKGKMKNEKRLSNNKDKKIYFKAQRRRTPVPPPQEHRDSDEGDKFPRGTIRSSASNPNTGRTEVLRATKKAWSTHSDEDDSDNEQNVENVLRCCQTPGLRADELPETRKDKINAGAGLADINPMAIDQSVGFDSIGGLSGHIAALKEMIVFPLLYPEVFNNFKIQPPRGCLFYGPPGTGKTLVARALSNECSHGNRKVVFFMRKGADCLSKWVGESERQLRLLFERAYQMRPSIIFFDEIDGLAPVRSSRQEQIHSSIVSTLLALMDGLDSRGEVVVIGATNRLDSIDPALRRPGRFDRELFFGLPNRECRKEILKIHTQQWKPPPCEDFLDELAEKCVGYCGADIRAVCTEAALCALRRRYPQIYSTSQKLLLDVSSISVTSCDFVEAISKMSPASQRSVALPAKPLSSVVFPLLAAALQDILDAVQRLFPHAEQGMKRKRTPDLTSGIINDGLMYEGNDGSSTSSISTPYKSKSKHFLDFASSAIKQPTSYRPRMLLAGRLGAGEASHFAPAVLHALERFAVHSLDSALLFGVSVTSPEEACTQAFCEARRTSPSILYIPHIEHWWDTAGAALRVSFLSLISSIPSFCPILLLGTCSIPYQQLDPEIRNLFREEYGEVYTISPPTRQERTDFFQDLILNQATEAPPSSKKALAETLEILPLAPLPPSHLSEQEQIHLEEQEEVVQRELRLFLRNITERLNLDRRFKAFTNPVDTEEVPDYLMVIKKPMDMSTLLTNIDEHKYVTVREYMEDADLIWQNALMYNPESHPLAHHIRHHAYALKDTLRAIIKDELDKDFDRVCEEIRESRNNRALKKKRYKNLWKSKWSTGVIKKTKRKKLASSSCSSTSSKSNSYLGPEKNTVVEIRLANTSSVPSSSTISESSYGELNNLTAAMNGSHHDLNGGLMNGYHHPEEKDRGRLRLNLRSQITTSKRPLHLTTRMNGFCLNTSEKHTRHDVGADKAQQFEGNGSVEISDDVTPPLVIDRSKLKSLLSRAVDKTEGTEVEPLEKLYALLAQCIYRHRKNYNKTELVQEMKKEIDCFLF